MLAAQTQSINMEGTINFEISDRSLYVKNVRLEDSDGTPTEITSFMPGYINDGITLSLGTHTVSNTSFKIHFDLINTTSNTYEAGDVNLSSELQSANVIASASGTISPTTEDIPEGENYAPITSTTPISGTITLFINSPNTTSIDLSGITVAIDEAAVVYSDFIFRNTSSNTGELYKYIGKDTEVVIPSSYSIVDNKFVEGDTYTVTAIADGFDSGDASVRDDFVFGNVSTALQSVVLPDTIERIGDYAFGDCTALTSINIPESVVSIGERALPTSLGNTTSENNGVYVGTQENPYLMLVDTETTDFTSFTINSNCKIIGMNAFKGCTALTTITIPASVITIDYSAFGYGSNYAERCRSLESVIFETNSQLKDIASSAFNGCSSLTTIVLPQSVERIGGFVFQSCTSLQYNTSNSGLYLGTESEAYFALIATDGTSFTTFTVDPSCQVIANQAFSNVTATEIVIPASVKNIHDLAFGIARASISAVNVNESNQNYASEGGVLFNKDKTALLYYPEHKADTSYQVPSSVEYINAVTFRNSQGFPNLTSITIPGNVRVVSDMAFYMMRSTLSEIIIQEGVMYVGQDAFGDGNITGTISIPNSLIYIGNSAFSLNGYTNGNQYAEGLYIGNDENPYLYLYDTTTTDMTTFNVTEGCKFIGDYAFESCSFTSINIPSTLIGFGNSPFHFCEHFANINVDENNTVYSSQDGVLFNKDKTALILYPAGKTETTYQVPDGVKILAGGLSSSALTEVSLPDSLEILASGFGSSLQTVNIGPNSQLKTIGSYAFASCSSLQSINLSSDNQLQSIGSYAFLGCSNLENIDFINNGKITEIADCAFQNCTSLTTVTIPDIVTSIGASAFSGCSSLATVNIDLNNSQISEIGDSAFYNCSALTTISIPASVTELSNTFVGCTSLESVIFGENSQLTRLDNTAFWNCSSLKSIVIPANVTYIQYSSAGVFSGCSSLATVTIESAPIYQTVDGTNNGYLLQRATTVKVPTSIVNSYGNSYLESSNFTTGTETIGGVKYTVFTKVGA